MALRDTDDELAVLLNVNAFCVLGVRAGRHVGHVLRIGRTRHALGPVGRRVRRR